MSLLSQATLIASQCHNGQLRKESNLPYLVHPVEGVLLLQRDGCDDEATLAAMMLHDCLEDDAEEPIDINDLIKQLDYNLEVATIVADLTCVGDKKVYIESFRNKPIEALVIKLYDRYINVHDFSRTKNQLKSYYTEYANKGLPIIETVLIKGKHIEAKYGEQFNDFCQMRAQELNDMAALHI